MLKLNTVEDTIAFAREALDTPGADVVVAQKPSGKFVKAERLAEDASGVTYNRDGEFEQEWSAKAGDWLVTACDADGNAFTAKDADGVERVNAWPMSEATLMEKYDVPEGAGGTLVVEAKSVPQKFVMLDERVGVPEDGISVHQSWGSDEVMARGAALNVEGIESGDVYAVDPTFFAENYEVVLHMDNPSIEEATAVKTLGVDDVDSFSKEVIADMDVEHRGFPSFAELRARAMAERSAGKDLGGVPEQDGVVQTSVDKELE